jgi:predicted MFS family arabinose efflux permease
MLLTLSAGALLSTMASIGITPFLLDVARDLQTDLSASSNLVALQSVSWGVASVFAGALSDRLGRRPILAIGLLGLALSGLGMAASSDYQAAAAWRLFGGLGGGSFMGAVFATVSDHVPPAKRGRWLGWVITGQSLALVLGVPAMTLIGSIGGWRGATVVHAVVLLGVVAGVWWSVPTGPARPGRERPMPVRALAGLVGPRLLALLAATSAERVCYAAVAVFLPTFLLTRYAVTPQALAGGLLLVALGNLVGNVLGGQLSDRVPSRPVLAAASLLVSGSLALPLLLWGPSVQASVGLGFAYTLVNAVCRPALLSVVSDVSSEARGAVLGLNITFSSLGWVASTAVGGVIVGESGFGGLGVLTFVAGALGGCCLLLTCLPVQSMRVSGGHGKTQRPLVAEGADPARALRRLDA